MPLHAGQCSASSAYNDYYDAAKAVEPSSRTYWSNRLPGEAAAWQYRLPEPAKVHSVEVVPFGNMRSVVYTFHVIPVGSREVHEVGRLRASPSPGAITFTLPEDLGPIQCLRVSFEGHQSKHVEEQYHTIAAFRLFKAPERAEVDRYGQPQSLLHAMSIHLLKAAQAAAGAASSDPGAADALLSLQEALFTLARGTGSAVVLVNALTAFLLGDGSATAGERWAAQVHPRLRQAAMQLAGDMVSWTVPPAAVEPLLRSAPDGLKQVQSNLDPAVDQDLTGFIGELEALPSASAPASTASPQLMHQSSLGPGSGAVALASSDHSPLVTEAAWDPAGTHCVELAEGGTGIISQRTGAFAQLRAGLTAGVHVWELNLTTDKAGSECTCFGLAQRPVPLVSYASNESLWLVRAFNGKLYNRGRLLEGKRSAKIPPGSRVRMTFNANSGTLSCAIVPPGGHAVDCGVVLRDVVPDRPGAPLYPVVMFYSSQRRVDIASPVLSFPSWGAYDAFARRCPPGTPLAADAVGLSAPPRPPASAAAEVPTSGGSSLPGLEVGVALPLSGTSHSLFTATAASMPCTTPGVESTPEGGASAGAAHRPDVPSGSDVPPVDRPWSCPMCTFENPPTAEKCGMCDNARPAPAPDSSVTGRDRGGAAPWACAVCTLVNPAADAKCSACGADRPADTGSSMPTEAPLPALSSEADAALSRAASAWGVASFGQLVTRLLRHMVRLAHFEAARCRTELMMQGDSAGAFSGTAQAATERRLDIASPLVVEAVPAAFNALRQLLEAAIQVVQTCAPCSPPAKAPFDSAPGSPMSPPRGLSRANSELVGSPASPAGASPTQLAGLQARTAVAAIARLVAAQLERFAESGIEAAAEKLLVRPEVGARDQWVLAREVQGCTALLLRQVVSVPAVEGILSAGVSAMPALEAADRSFARAYGAAADPSAAPIKPLPTPQAAAGEPATAMPSSAAGSRDPASSGTADALWEAAPFLSTNLGHALGTLLAAPQQWACVLSGLHNMLTSPPPAEAVTSSRACTSSAIMFASELLRSISTNQQGPSVRSVHRLVLQDLATASMASAETGTAFDLFQGGKTVAGQLSAIVQATVEAAISGKPPAAMPGLAALTLRDVQLLGAAALAFKQVYITHAAALAWAASRHQAEAWHDFSFDLAQWPVETMETLPRRLSDVAGALPGGPTPLVSNVSIFAPQASAAIQGLLQLVNKAVDFAQALVQARVEPASVQDATGALGSEGKGAAAASPQRTVAPLRSPDTDMAALPASSMSESPVLDLATTCTAVLSAFVDLAPDAPGANAAGETPPLPAVSMYFAEAALPKLQRLLAQTAALGIPDATGRVPSASFTSAVLEVGDAEGRAAEAVRNAWEDVLAQHGPTDEVAMDAYVLSAAFGVDAGVPVPRPPADAQVVGAMQADDMRRHCMRTLRRSILPSHSAARLLHIVAFAASRLAASLAAGIAEEEAEEAVGPWLDRSILSAGPWSARGGTPGQRLASALVGAPQPAEGASPTVGAALSALMPWGAEFGSIDPVLCRSGVLRAVVQAVAAEGERLVQHGAASLQTTVPELAISTSELAFVARTALHPGIQDAAFKRMANVVRRDEAPATPGSATGMATFFDRLRPEAPGGKSQTLTKLLVWARGSYTMSRIAAKRFDKADHTLVGAAFAAILWHTGAWHLAAEGLGKLEAGEAAPVPAAVAKAFSRAFQVHNWAGKAEASKVQPEAGTASISGAQLQGEAGEAACVFHARHALGVSEDAAAPVLAGAAAAATAAGGASESKEASGMAGATQAIALAATERRLAAVRRGLLRRRRLVPRPHSTPAAAQADALARCVSLLSLQPLVPPGSLALPDTVEPVADMAVAYIRMGGAAPPGTLPCLAICARTRARQRMQGLQAMQGILSALGSPVAGDGSLSLYYPSALRAALLPQRTALRGRCAFSMRRRADAGTMARAPSGMGVTSLSAQHLHRVQRGGESSALAQAYETALLRSIDQFARAGGAAEGEGEDGLGGGGDLGTWSVRHDPLKGLGGGGGGCTGSVGEAWRALQDTLLRLYAAATVGCEAPSSHEAGGRSSRVLSPRGDAAHVLPMGAVAVSALTTACTGDSTGGSGGLATLWAAGGIPAAVASLHPGGLPGPSLARTAHCQVAKGEVQTSSAHAPLPLARRWASAAAAAALQVWVPTLVQGSVTACMASARGAEQVLAPVAETLAALGCDARHEGVARLQSAAQQCAAHGLHLAPYAHAGHLAALGGMLVRKDTGGIGTGPCPTLAVHGACASTTQALLAALDSNCADLTGSLHRAMRGSGGAGDALHTADEADAQARTEAAEVAAFHCLRLLHVLWHGAATAGVCPAAGAVEGDLAAQSTQATQWLLPSEAVVDSALRVNMALGGGAGPVLAVLKQPGALQALATAALVGSPRMRGLAVRLLPQLASVVPPADMDAAVAKAVEVLELLGMPVAPVALTSFSPKSLSSLLLSAAATVLSCAEGTPAFCSPEGGLPQRAGVPASHCGLPSTPAFFDRYHSPSRPNGVGVGQAEMVVANAAVTGLRQLLVAADLTPDAHSNLKAWKHAVSTAISTGVQTVVDLLPSPTRGGPAPPHIDRALWQYAYASACFCVLGGDLEAPAPGARVALSASNAAARVATTASILEMANSPAGGSAATTAGAGVPPAPSLSRQGSGGAGVSQAAAAARRSLLELLHEPMAEATVVSVDAVTGKVTLLLDSAVAGVVAENTNAALVDAACKPASASDLRCFGKAAGVPHLAAVDQLTVQSALCPAFSAATAGAGTASGKSALSAGGVRSRLLTLKQEDVVLVSTVRASADAFPFSPAFLRSLARILNTAVDVPEPDAEGPAATMVAPGMCGSVSSPPPPLDSSISPTSGQSIADMDAGTLAMAQLRSKATQAGLTMLASPANSRTALQAGMLPTFMNLALSAAPMTEFVALPWLKHRSRTLLAFRGDAAAGAVWIGDASRRDTPVAERVSWLPREGEEASPSKPRRGRGSSSVSAVVDKSSAAGEVSRHEAAATLSSMGYPMELCVKALAFNADDAQRAAEWLLSGQADAFVRAGGLDAAAKDSTAKTKDPRATAARELAMMVGMPQHLVYAALEMHLDDGNAATSWLLEQGGFYTAREYYAESKAQVGRGGSTEVRARALAPSARSALDFVPAGAGLGMGSRKEERPAAEESGGAAAGSGAPAEATSSEDAVSQLHMSEGGHRGAADVSLARLSGAGGSTGATLLPGQVVVVSTSEGDLPLFGLNSVVGTVVGGTLRNHMVDVLVPLPACGRLHTQRVSLDSVRVVERIYAHPNRDASSLAYLSAAAESALAVLAARRAVLSLMVAWPSALPFTVEAMGGPDRLLSLAKFVAASECIFGAQASSGAALGNTVQSPLMLVVQNKLLSLVAAEVAGAEGGILHALVQDCARNVSAATEPQEARESEMRESLHPVWGPAEFSGSVTFEGAKALVVHFDAQTNLPTEGAEARLQFFAGKKGGGAVGPALRVIQGKADLSPLVLQGDRVVYKYAASAPSGMQECWGFRFHVSPMQGLQWMRERQVLGSPSLEWACWLLRLLQAEEASGHDDTRAALVHSPSIFNALVLYIRTPSVPFKPLVVDIVTQLLARPHLFRAHMERFCRGGRGEQQDFKKLEEVETAVHEAIQARKSSGQVFLPDSLQALAELGAASRSANMAHHLRSGPLRQQSLSELVEEGGLFRAARLKVTTHLQDIPPEASLDVRGLMLDVLDIARAWRAGALQPGRVLGIVAHACAKGWVGPSSASGSIPRAEVGDAALVRTVRHLHGWTTAMDEQLVRFSLTVARECSEAVDSIAPRTIGQRAEAARAVGTLRSEYPVLAQADQGSIEARCALLQLLNRRLARCIESVNLSRVSLPWSLASHLRALGHIILPDTRTRLVEAAIEASWVAGTSSLTVTLDNSAAFTSRERGVKDFSRSRCIFAQTFRQLRRARRSAFRCKLDERQRLFRVKFSGEDGVDWGGLYRDSMSRMVSEVFSTELDLLVPTPNGVAEEGTNMDKFLPNPNRFSPEDLDAFEFLGVLMGISMRQKQYLPFEFPPMVWKMLTGQTVDMNDLADVDDKTAHRLRSVRAAAKSVRAGGSLEAAQQQLAGQAFTVNSCTGQVVELVGKGAEMAVTVDDADTFARLALNYRLHEFEAQVDAIRRGFADVVPARVLSLCSFQELELMTCGDPTIDVELLKVKTTYHGCSSVRPAPARHSPLSRAAPHPHSPPPSPFAARPHVPQVLAHHGGAVQRGQVQLCPICVGAVTPAQAVRVGHGQALQAHQAWRRGRPTASCVPPWRGDSCCAHALTATPRCPPIQLPTPASTSLNFPITALRRS